MLRAVPAFCPKTISDWLAPFASVPVIVKDRATSLPTEVIEIRRGSTKVAVPDDVKTPPIVRFPAALIVVATEIPSLSAGVVKVP